ncbi:TIGR01457 family HAD-type hydrolase [Virgibacillus soli]|uniref:TIGR01457 family HAD-type hydrolase n=1 Tax=Paracerasibacillus soli TaxID=480284 RepID=UPI0035E91F7F
MKKYGGYLIDLDGTMYRGNKVIEAAPLFINELVKKDIPYLFLTNNSSRTPEQIATRLNDMGIQTESGHVFTTSMATASYIKQQSPNATCYVIGEEGLFRALQQEEIEIVHDEHCDYVVIGIDREITYEKLAIACLAVRNGATLISTNSDAAIPTERGLLPGNGSMTAVISVSTGKEPIYIGKPESIIVQEALSRLGTSAEETLIVGDNYETDIMAGIYSNVDTLMVFTGFTPFQAYKHLPIKPTYYVQQLTEWIPYIKE